MAVSAITLNSVTFYVDDIATEHEKIGTAIQAANGARRWAHRANKRQWTLTWNTASLTELTAIRAIFALTTTFTFVDENGASATVFCQAGALKSSVDTLAYASGAQVLYYKVTLQLTEA